MKVIKKIKLQNFKRFKEFKTEFDGSLNLLLGDNESGKSTILSAIDIVLSGSRSKVESAGLESLFNIQVIEDFLDPRKRDDRTVANLPVLFVEIFLNDQNTNYLNGRFNSEERDHDGLRFECRPIEDLTQEIQEILNQEGASFPFEYYRISFKTFYGEAFSSHRRPVKHLLLDNTQINNEYATRAYIKDLYNSQVEGAERNKHHFEYRQHKKNFEATILSDLNNRPGNYSFTLKTNSKSNLGTDLTISEDNVAIENKGKGKQCFIKTEFALTGSENKLDIILLEEPENHLSHTNMKKLIQRISQSQNKQLFVATHSNLISTRLDLRRSIFLNSRSATKVSLRDISPETANFFMKAADNNILEFIQSQKAILVEGDAEYMLIELLFKKIKDINPEEADVHIISVNGVRFPRYLEIAKILNIKTAVITDNDKNYHQNITEKYKTYSADTNIKIFTEEDELNYTFEVVMYHNNKKICEELFSEGRTSLTVLDYMLKNKAEAAFQLLTKKKDELSVPEYIKKAIEWISE